MKLSKRRPGYPSRSWNSWTEDFFNRDLINFFGGDSWGAIPPVNVKEEEDRFVLELAAPGLEKEDFNIELQHGTLTLSAQKREEKVEEEKDRYRRREFNFIGFKRSFQVPEEVDAEQVKATYDKGVLIVSLTKKDEAASNKKRKIEIS